MKTVKELVLEAMLHTQYTQDDKKGICYSVECYARKYFDDFMVCDAFDNFLLHLETNWCYYSGRRTYPVPHPTDSPYRAFEDAYLSKSLWQGEYGNKRKQLLQFLIDNIDAMNDDGSINEQHVITQSQENK